MGRPHRDGEGGVTRVVDRAGNPYFRDSLSGLDGSVAGVSCSYNNNNPASDEAVDFNTKRALTTGKHLGVKLVTQTEIHPVDAQELGISIDIFADVLQRPHDVAGSTAPI